MEQGVAAKLPSPSDFVVTPYLDGGGEFADAEVRRSWQEEPASTSINVDIAEDIEEAFNDRFRVPAVASDAFRVGQREYRQAVRSIAMPDRRFQ